jgi:hypothetical protein
MKKLLIGLLALGSISSFAGIHLKCTANPYAESNGIMQPYGHASEGSFSIVLYNALMADCTDLKTGEDMYVVMEGFGPGIKLSSSNFIMTCPLVSKKRLKRRQHMSFFNTRISASAIVGANAGVSVNGRGGVCVSAGIEIGVGGSVEIGKMEIGIGNVPVNYL